MSISKKVQQTCGAAGTWPDDDEEDDIQEDEIDWPSRATAVAGCSIDVHVDG